MIMIVSTQYSKSLLSVITMQDQKEDNTVDGKEPLGTLQET